MAERQAEALTLQAASANPCSSSLDGFVKSPFLSVMKFITTCRACAYICELNNRTEQKLNKFSNECATSQLTEWVWESWQSEEGGKDTKAETMLWEKGMSFKIV